MPDCAIRYPTTSTLDSKTHISSHYVERLVVLLLSITTDRDVRREVTIVYKSNRMHPVGVFGVLFRMPICRPVLAMNLVCRAGAI